MIVDVHEFSGDGVFANYCLCRMTVLVERDAYEVHDSSIRMTEPSWGDGIRPIVLHTKSRSNIILAIKHFHMHAGHSYYGVNSLLFGMLTQGCRIGTVKPHAVCTSPDRVSMLGERVCSVVTVNCHAQAKRKTVTNLSNTSITLSSTWRNLIHFLLRSTWGPANRIQGVRNGLTERCPRIHRSLHNPGGWNGARQG